MLCQRAFFSISVHAPISAFRNTPLRSKNLPLEEEEEQVEIVD